jgi:hypothetical protein
MVMQRTSARALGGNSTRLRHCDSAKHSNDIDILRNAVAPENPVQHANKIRCCQHHPNGGFPACYSHIGCLYVAKLEIFLCDPLAREAQITPPKQAQPRRHAGALIFCRVSYSDSFVLQRYLPESPSRLSLHGTKKTGRWTQRYTLYIKK